MGVTSGGVSLAAVLILGLSGVATAREVGSVAEATKAERSKGHGFKRGGLATPAYTATSRATSKEQPYTWPVSDRYGPVSKPFFGRAY